MIHFSFQGDAAVKSAPPPPVVVVDAETMTGLLSLTDLFVNGNSALESVKGVERLEGLTRLDLRCDVVPCLLYLY